MMPGMITLWSGAIVDIPTGWILCNGSDGTPDLRNRFIVAAGNTYAVDDTGGSVSHFHHIPAGTDIAAGTDFSDDEEYANHLPPYYALAFIMKT